MPLNTSQPAVISNQKLAGANVSSQVQGLRQVGGQLAGYAASAFDQLQASINSLYSLLKQPANPLESFSVLDSSGALIAWAGSEVINNVSYEGIWAKMLYIGGNDASSAPFFTDSFGNVVIGNNGSVQIDNPLGQQEGFIGVNPDPALNVSAVTNVSGVIGITTSSANTYVTGDAVITNLPGLSVGTGAFAITVIDSTHFTLNGSTYAAGYSGSGTVFRYYGGVWTQTAAFGGTGFADAPFRVYANGEVLLMNNSGGATTTINNLPDVTGVAGIEVKDNTYEYFSILTQSGIRVDTSTGSPMIDLTVAWPASGNYLPTFTLRDYASNLARITPSSGLTFPNTGGTYGPSTMLLNGSNGSVQINALSSLSGIAGMEIFDLTLSFYSTSTQGGFRVYSPSNTPIIDLTAPYSVGSWTAILQMRDSSGDIVTLKPGPGLQFPGAATYGPSQMTTANGQFTALVGPGSVQVDSSGNLGVGPSVPSFPLSVANGGTASTTAAGARSALSAVSRTTSITAPSGGTIIDTQARTAINAIIAALNA